MNLVVIKLATQVLAGAGATKVVNDIVRNNVTVVTKLDRILVTAGSLVFGGMAYDHAGIYVDKCIRELQENVKFERKDKSVKVELVPKIEDEDSNGNGNGGQDEKTS